jgi:hypothetical protein
MQTPPDPETILPRAWADVLARIQQALEQAETKSAERERMLESGPDSDPTARAAAWQQGLERLREGLDRLQAGAGKAEETVALADAALGAGADMVRRWLATGQQLAERVAAAIK